MLKILNTGQIRALDAYTIEHEPILSIDLMERACRAFVSWFVERFDVSNKVGIVCGTGNNGGDGLGVARLLFEWGYPVKVWIVKGSVPESIDFASNLKKISNHVEVNEITTAADRGLFHDRDVLIDAIFGSGLSRPAEGIYSQAIQCLNETKACRVAIDIPSGLMADAHSKGSIVNADFTASFQLPKLAFFMPENYRYTGEWFLVDIGLKKSFIKEATSDHFFLQRKDIKRIKKIRKKFDHKGNYGRAMLIAGSYGKMGAAVLASRAAMRSGPGLLTVHVPQCGYQILQSSVPEAMVSVDEKEDSFSVVPDTTQMDVVGIGPGIGQHKDTGEAFGKLLKTSAKSMVIDADALNILSANPDFQKMLPPDSILTPHPKEFERLSGIWRDDFERLDKLKQLAAKLNAVIVLKGAYSTIASPDGKIYFNGTGNPGMATGGSGDVLTGILTGILAQGYSPIETAIMGVYLHGLAGDLAAIENGMDGLIASDLIEFLPKAFKAI
ncbi:MAG TPA: NAD(P)H-hydrate dehydratase [Cyclobacteriaceae bacterium]|nr:NAD(P)H-hydrate dehydratase [Cyclobacteriaceae bacterium]